MTSLSCFKLKRTKCETFIQKGINDTSFAEIQEGSRSCGAIKFKNFAIFSVILGQKHPNNGEIWHNGGDFGPLRCVKFHLDRSNESPFRGTTNLDIPTWVNLIPVLLLLLLNMSYLCSILSFISCRVTVLCGQTATTLYNIQTEPKTCRFTFDYNSCVS